jgi:hypothetical protein
VKCNVVTLSLETDVTNSYHAKRLPLRDPRDNFIWLMHTADQNDQEFRRDKSRISKMSISVCRRQIENLSEIFSNSLPNANRGTRIFREMLFHCDGPLTLDYSPKISSRWEPIQAFSRDQLYYYLFHLLLACVDDRRKFTHWNCESDGTGAFTLHLRRGAVNR